MTRTGFINRISLAFALLLSLPCLAARADSASASFSTGTTVTNRCVISVASLAFGEYLAAGTNATTPLDGTGTVSVACTKGASATIGIGQGTNPNGSSTDAAPKRRMASGTQKLRYDLYRDSGRTSVWGNTVATAKSYSAASVSTASITIYARMPAGQDVGAGDFSDTVTATITF